ncbi:MAG: lytic transglycosylase domain-containing protein [Sphingobacteriales bacterium]|nr:MAG: lytic transglycosylase domain-containing protein [Sphingobacteriales bacterium]
MQTRVLFMATIAMLAGTTLSAQKHTSVTIPAKSRLVVEHSDTLIVSKPAISPNPTAVLASNAPATAPVLKPVPTPAPVAAKPSTITPATAAAILSGKPAPDAAPAVPTAVATTASKFKAVPLAGTSYYGEMNDFVTDFVRKYFQSHNRTLNVVQGKGNTIFSLIDNILEKHDIPKELKYLAVIESALNNNAVSRVGAVGPWQFMASTGRLMGLTINGKRDERKDFHKSTTAAAKYLTYLYGELNDWLLVVAAYNSGPTPVQRAIAKTGSRNFWDIKPYLPRETQGHVLAFIATATIFENLSKFISTGSIPTDFNFKTGAAAAPATGAVKKAVSPFTPEELKNMAMVRISEPLSIDLMVQELGIDKRLLNKWNPDYELFVYNTCPQEFYSLRIPKDKLDTFVDKKETLTKRSRQIFANLTM